MTDPTPEGIAIIGVAGRFPGAANVNEFWRNIIGGVESITTFTDEELAESGFDAAALRKQPGFIAARGLLEKADWFDAAFFGVNPKEAEVTDPQQRLFLEAAWEALENSGYCPEQFHGLIGVYAGMGNNTYFLNNLYSRPDLVNLVGEMVTMMANEKDFLATRVAYKLDLKGPAININTACSTSLVAVCQACQALLNFQCDLALAGAVSVNFPQKRGYHFQEGGIVSPDGHCRAFDAQAQGTVASDGLGIVVLKRLAEALNDGDEIYAVIKGTGLNNDGSSKVSFSSPSVVGQAEVIAFAQAQAGFDPATISYVEAHGTGTPLGDPIEIEGLKQAFGAAGKKNFCALGSVKSNIGHLDTAAGVAGLIKTALALKHKKLPPSLHFTKPNPRIDFANSPFYVNTTHADWPDAATPRRAGVSSFGLGGTNAHVVLEEALAPRPSSHARDWQLLVWSARTESALETATVNLLNFFKSHPDANLADVAFSMQLGRKAFEHRRMLVCRDIADAVKALETRDVKRVLTQHTTVSNPSVGFMFPGQGAQYVNMGAELYRTESVFAEEVDRCAKILQPHLGMDLRSVIFPQGETKAAEEILVQTRITQPALFAIEYALARLWMSWGVKPRAMIGHSVGEYVAGCLAGVFTLEEALTLVVQRARLVQMQPGGAMLAVRLPEKDVQPLLQGGLSIAAINAPNLCVVSGPFESIERLEKQLNERGIAGRRLATSHAFHSAMMEPVIGPFTELLQKTKLREPTLPYVSNVTARWIKPEEATNPKYWASHVRQTVRFADGVGELLKEPQIVLVEVGPGQTLSALTRQHPLCAAGRTIVSSLAASKDAQLETNAMLTALGKLWLAGAAVDWAAFHKNFQRRRVPLPTYPFERKRFWAEPGHRNGKQKTLISNTEHRTSNIEITENQEQSPVDQRGPASRKEQIIAALSEQLQELSGKAAADISSTATFLEMGFDSLFLAQASRAFDKKFGIKVTFRQLQENLSTLNDVANYFDEKLPANVFSSSGAHDSPAMQTAQRAVPANEQRDGTLPLSEEQMEIWLATQWGENGSRAFNQLVSVRLRGVLHREMLSDSLNELVARHGALRTTFLADGSGQKVAAEQRIEVAFTDISKSDSLAEISQGGGAPPPYHSALARILQQEDETVFDLVRGPLLRARLIKLAEDEHELLLASHHIVLDGWSISVALRELGHIYSAKSRGNSGTLKFALQFSDYLKWQNSSECREASARAETYWFGQFANPPAPIELPGDHARPAAQSHRAGTESLTLSPALHQSLKGAAAREGVTVFTYLLASLNVWLHRLSGQDDLAVGIPAAGHVAMGAQGTEMDAATLVGHCVNLLPLRSQCHDALSFVEYLRTIKQLMLDAHEHQPFTYGNLIKRLNLPRDASRAPLLSVMFNVIRPRTDVEFSGLEIEYEMARKGFTVFDLNIDVVDSETELRLDCRFNCDLFEAETMRRWLGHWQTLLEATLREPRQSVGALQMLNASERETILSDWNNTKAKYPQLECVPQLFEKQVRENPKAIAVRFEDKRLTYEELNAKANRLAHYLKQQGVGPEKLVGICVERSLEMVVGLLGILKAGGAYLPLDPNYPSERLEFILQDSKTQVLLTQRSLISRLPDAARSSGVQVVCLDDEFQQPEANLEQQATQENLAYVLYTSGSTGKPKGVQIGHRALVNFLWSMRREPELEATDVLLAVTTLSFDIAGLELWLPLTIGAQVVIARSDTVREGKKLAAQLDEYDATVMQATPATWRMLIEAGWRGNPRLKALCGGEGWGADLAQSLLPKCSSLWNMYGPTETTIWSAVSRVGENEAPMIGGPIANTQFYVLDGQMQPVPVGVAAELHIGGDGLARGYLGRPELTMEKFVADPFGAKGNDETSNTEHRTSNIELKSVPSTQSSRLYKTGDLVRYRGRGQIEFLGRMDHQVKIRGFRIELGEIEAVLCRHESVKEAVVVAREDVGGGKRLVGYVVARSLQPGATELKAHITAHLPEYMVPSAFVILDKLPLTPNGKVDRKALPKPEEQVEAGDFTLPTTTAELAVAKLWCEVLGLKRVGLHDDFFELGGHSLMATQLISRLEKFHKVKITLRDIFGSPTVAAMSRWLEKKEESSAQRNRPNAKAPAMAQG